LNVGYARISGLLLINAHVAGGILDSRSIANVLIKFLQQGNYASFRQRENDWPKLLTDNRQSGCGLSRVIEPTSAPLLFPFENKEDWLALIGIVLCLSHRLKVGRKLEVVGALKLALQNLVVRRNLVVKTEFSRQTGLVLWNLVVRRDWYFGI
jgi:hypothetical protein